MMRSIHPILIAAAALAMARTESVAQTPDGEQALARATATAILDIYKPDLFLIAPPPARFDTMAAVELLAQAPGRQDPEADYALYIGTRGTRVEGDTTVVLVILRKHTRGTGLNFWEQMDEFRFVRDGDTWRFVRYMVIGSADGGSVRGG